MGKRFGNISRNLISMKGMALFLFSLSCSVALAQEKELMPTISFYKDSVPVLEVIQKLDIETEYECVYSTNTFDQNNLLSLSKKHYTGEEVISILRNQGDLLIKETGNRLLILGNYSSGKRKEIVLSGVVLDAYSREILPGASVFLSNRKAGTYTDNAGFFSLILSDDLPDSVGLEIGYVGHETLVLDLHPGRSYQSEFLLFPNSRVQEVLISGRIVDAWSQVDSVELNTFPGYRFLPGSLGAHDVFSELAMLPGVNRGHDFQAGLSLRGLPSSNIQYLVDGIPLYHPNHLFGLISAVNQSSLHQIELYKDHTPLHLSGCLSGVVNQQLKSGNALTHSRMVGFSHEAVNLQLEGPIIWNKSSYSFGVRKSIVDYYLPEILAQWTDIQNSELGYYDVNAKLTHRINARNTLEIFGFQSSDKYLFQQEATDKQQRNSLSWSNRILSAKWKGILGDRLLSSSQLAWTSYRSDKQYLQYANVLGADSYYFYQIAQSNISSFIFKQQHSYFLNNHWQLDAGFQLTRRDVNPLVFKSLIVEEDFSEPLLESNADSLSWDFNAFVSLLWNWRNTLLVEPGLQLNYYHAGLNSSFVGLNPLLRLEWLLDGQNKFRSTLQKTNQNLHLLNAHNIGIAPDLWVSSSSLLPPEEMWQWSLEYTKVFASWGKLNVSLYGRKMENLIEYIQLADRYDPGFSDGTIIPVFSNPDNLLDRVETLKGLGYGMELSFGAKWQDLNFELSYAYANTDLFTMKGERFPSDQDFTHSAHFFAEYFLTPRWLLFTNAYFHSGGPYTLPLDVYKNEKDEWIFAFTQKNTQRYRSFQSISIGSKYRYEISKTSSFEFDFGLRNVLNHANPLFVYLSEKDNKIEVRQMNGLPLYPYFKWIQQF